MSHTCSICLDEIEVAVTGQVTLSCGHQGHLGCISKWFYRQDKSSCPLCRQEMEGVGDVWANNEEDEEDSDDDDETESTLSEDENVEAAEERRPDFAHFNFSQFNDMLVECEVAPITPEVWDGLLDIFTEVDPSYPSEKRVRIWQLDLQCYIAGRSNRVLTDEMWEHIAARAARPVTGAFVSATASFSQPIGIPIPSGCAPRPPAPLRVVWRLMDTGAWQRDVMNPEEETGVQSSNPALIASSALKIQSVWRSYVARRS